MCLAIMACAVCRKKVLIRNPLNVLGGNLGDLGGDFAKVSKYIKGKIYEIYVKQ